MTMSIPMVTLVKMGFCVALGFYLGRGAFTCAVDFTIWAIGKVSRCF